MLAASHTMARGDKRQTKGLDQLVERLDDAADLPWMASLTPAHSRPT